MPQVVDADPRDAGVRAEPVEVVEDRLGPQRGTVELAEHEIARYPEFCLLAGLALEGMRALQPRVLILDDALSSVDTMTEERILTALQDVMKGRTTILISHRVSTVRHADRIYVIEYGKVAEEGSHSELIGQGGYYADLYQKQLLEEELEAI